MEHLINGISYSNQALNQGYERIINMLYSMLGSYENCETENNFEPFIIQGQRTCIQMQGFYNLIGGDAFMTISATIKGMIDCKELNHKKVKSWIFYCIDLVKKMKVAE